MADVTPADLRTRIASAFDRRGWSYEPGLAEKMLGGLASGSEIFVDDLAQRIPADYLDRNGINRDQLIVALAELNGLTLDAAPSTQTIIVNDNRYQVNVSDQGRIEDSNINIGGSQINVSVSAPRTDVLAALRVLVVAAFDGDWNEEALSEIAGLIDARHDISVEDVRALTVEVGSEQKASKRAIRGMLDNVATGTIVGTLSAGLSAGLGHLLANLPF